MWAKTSVVALPQYLLQEGHHVLTAAPGESRGRQRQHAAEGVQPGAAQGVHRRGEVLQQAQGQGSQALLQRLLDGQCAVLVGKGHQPGPARGSCQAPQGLKPAPREAAVHLGQQRRQAAEQGETAPDFQLQAVLPPAVQAGAEAVGPAAQLLQAALLGLPVALQQAQGCFAGQGPEGGRAHALADAQFCSTVVVAQHPLPL